MAAAAVMVRSPMPEGPVAANLLEKLDEAAKEGATAERPAATLPKQATQCPAGHGLVRLVGQAGSCDLCSKAVHEGQLVFECKPCNYYVCQSCRPITECNKGHSLQTSSALAGKCDGCSKPLRGGEVVSDCRECNWYLCSTCHLIKQCPAGHALQKWASQAPGTCDSCQKGVKKGAMVMDCRRCNWFMCEGCHPTSVPAKACYRVPQVVHVLPRCDVGHAMQPRGAKAGKCDGCGKLVKDKELVMSCEACNYYLCGTCSPVKHCPEGHELEAEMALKGRCDCCMKQVQENEMVMQCRQCNWYLCSTCHVARQ